MPAYELSDSSREEITSAAEAQLRKHSGGTAESEAAFKKFSANIRWIARSTETHVMYA